MGCECGCEHWKKHEKSEHWIEYGDEMTNMFVNMANEAWNDVFMEKARKHWEKVHGKDMDEIARASVQASFDYHMSRMGTDKAKMDAVEKMKKLMK